MEERNGTPRECLGCPMEGVMCGNPLYCLTRLLEVTPPVETADDEK